MFTFIVLNLTTVWLTDKDKWILSKPKKKKIIQKKWVVYYTVYTSMWCWHTNWRNDQVMKTTKMDKNHPQKLAVMKMWLVRASSGSRSCTWMKHTTPVLKYLEIIRRRNTWYPTWFTQPICWVCDIKSTICSFVYVNYTHSYVHIRFVCVHINEVSLCLLVSPFKLYRLKGCLRESFLKRKLWAFRQKVYIGGNCNWSHLMCFVFSKVYWKSRW